MDIHAPSHWRCADFISDLHLQAADRPTFTAWATYMQATQADAVFILGDLFEAWVGDDAALVSSSFEEECVEVLRLTGARLALFIMQGNRDFLLGPTFLQACHATALPDPSVIDFAGERWLLSHGDALCVDDFAYQAFRRQVRSAEWQQDFLRKPLAERQDIARGLRQASTAKMLDSMPYADVDHPAALSLLLTAKAGHLLHGHTHKPGHHLLAPGMERTVLSDWDATASPPRAEVLRLSTDNHGRVAAVRMPAALIAIPEA